MTVKYTAMLFMLSLMLNACQPATDQDKTTVAAPEGCSKELKVCEDGQTVSRNPSLDCAFDPCPPAPATDQCPGDMKQCPDGSFVIRDAANQCEFKPCPSATDKQPPSIFCPQDVRQCPDGSYVGRDPQQNCAFKLCPDGSRPSESSLKRIE